MSDEIIFLSEVYDEMPLDSNNSGTSVYLHIINENLQYLRTLGWQMYLNSDSISDACKLTFIPSRDTGGNIVDSDLIHGN